MRRGLQLLLFWRLLPAGLAVATAKPESLYPESTTAKWLFPQEKATFKSLSQGTFTLVSL
jgi:hypothetical protein